MSTCPDSELLRQNVALAINSNGLAGGRCVDGHPQTETIPDGSLEWNVSVEVAQLEEDGLGGGGDRRVGAVELV